jgi:hypothetical protein
MDRRIAASVGFAGSGAFHALGELGQSVFQSGDVARETFDLSIASVRCSSSGRGPRRIRGPGVSVRSVMSRSVLLARQATQHGGHGPGPQGHDSLPGLADLRVGGHGGKFALPQRDPVLRQFAWVRHIRCSGLTWIVVAEYPPHPPPPPPPPPPRGPPPHVPQHPGQSPPILRCPVRCCPDRRPSPCRIHPPRRPDHRRGRSAAKRQTGTPPGSERIHSIASAKYTVGRGKDTRYAWRCALRP